MNASEIMAIINLAEQEFRVRDWRSGDMRIWPLLRVRLFIDIWEQANNAVSGVMEPKRNSLGSMASRAIRLTRDISKQLAVRILDQASNDDYQRQAQFLFVSDGVSFTEIEGRCTERFCDPLIDEAQKRGLKTLLWTPGNLCLWPRFTPSAYIQPRLDLQNLVGAFHAWRGNVDLELPDYERFLNYLSSRNVSFAVLARARIARDAARLHALRAWYKKILQRIGPKLVAVVSYYGLETMALLAACRLLGVTTVDLQHGVQGKLHPAYGCWSSVPDEGFELLPDFFWCWSATEARAIDAWRLGKTQRHVPLIGGNPWLEHWRGDTDPLVARYDNLVGETKRKQSAQHHVLVTLQFGYLDKDFLDPLLVQVRSIGPQTAWWLRLHPTQMQYMDSLRAKVARLDLANVYVIEATRLPLYALLRNIDAHVTHSSSTVLEAENFGVKSIVTSEFGAELFSNEIARGVAYFCDLESKDFGSALKVCLSETIGANRAVGSGVTTCIGALLETTIGSANPA